MLQKPSVDDGKAIPGVSVRTAVSCWAIVLISSQSEEAAEGWNFLWNAYLEYDQETMDKWKDELNNLLVFVRSLPSPFSSLT